MNLVTVEIGWTKNRNKNTVVDKATDQLKKEIKQLVFVKKPINSSTLSLAVGVLKERQTISIYWFYLLYNYVVMSTKSK